jgi:hypothetical protein
MPAFPAFFDTCSLFGGVLNDLFLRLAEEGAYRLTWSEQILTELERNLAGRVGPDAAGRRVAAMRTAFPDAAVSGYQHLEPAMPVDEGDRHVAAAAAHSGAEVIVTANLKHFPVGPLREWHLTPTHPDDFLLDQLDLYPEIVQRCLDDLADSYESPPLTLDQILDRLAADVPRFAAAVRDS